MPQQQIEEQQPAANGHHTATSEQPAASQHMNPHAPPKPGNPKKSNRDAYSEGVMKVAGKQTVEYGVENHDELANKAEETYEDTKLKVQGWWQKNCGCLGGSVQFITVTSNHANMLTFALELRRMPSVVFCEYT